MKFRPFIGLALLLLAGQARAESFTLNDGDRVVLLGNTLIEREQRYGYWEADLLARFPGKKVIVRNLGWSGDTVFGEARAGFGSVADGFRHLKEHVVALKPTVLVIGYGTNESFAGEAGLPHFVQGLRTLLDTLAPTKARLVLLSPLRQEDLGPPLPSPTAQNRNLRLYADALRDEARKRGATFVDLLALLPDGSKLTPPAPLTYNAIHLTPWGYWRSAAALETGLGLADRLWRVEVHGSSLRSEGTKVERLGGKGLRLRITDEVLPPPPAPEKGAPPVKVLLAPRTLAVNGLKPGRYTLTVDGQTVATATEAQWAKGVVLSKGPEFVQAEKLRRTVVQKNELYFHRWRPQNETYLFGFRKHEQGKNATEIPKFDPLVAAKDEEIRKLTLPAAHVYELKPLR